MIPRHVIASRFDRLPGATRAGIWMTASAFCYAASAAIVRHMSADMPIFEMVFLRNLFALAFMMPWVASVGRAALRTDRLGMHTLRGLGSAVNISCQFGALALIPIADMAAINFMQPIFGSIIAVVVLKEVASGRRWTAVAVGFLGAMLIIRPGIATVDAGVLLALASALAGAVVAIMIKDLVRTEQPDTIVVYLFVFQTAIMLVPAILVWRAPTPGEIAWLAALGLIGVWLQRAFNRAMAAADATVALPFNFTRLIWASLIGWIVFAESPDAWTWAGGTLIFAASVLMARRHST
jgi:drug/metabolite transporter (DMT)-like permease